MDKILIKSIDNEKQASDRLDLASSNVEIDMHIETLNIASNVTNAYVRYKKEEQEYLKQMEKVESYYKIINAININN